MGFNAWFRKNQKRVYIIMIFAMGAWGIGSSAIYFIPQKPIGTISGEEITRDELTDFDSRWRRIFFASLQGNILDLVWKQMIFEREAQKSGLIVTNSDIEEGVHDLSIQLFGGKSNMTSEQLIMVLCNNFGVTRDQLLKSIKEAMSIYKLDFFIKNSVKVTEEEAWQRYSLENEKIKIKYVAFNADDFVETVTVTEEDIAGFYEKYKDMLPDKATGSFGYKEPEKIKIEYIMASYNELAEKASVTDDEALKYYEDNKDPEFIAPVKEITQSDKVDDQEKESDSEEKPKQYKSFAEVKESIENKLKNEKAKKTANELITKVDDEIYETLDKSTRPSFKKLANKHGLSYNLTKSSTNDSEFISFYEAEKLLIGANRFGSLAFEKEKFDPSQPLDSLEGKYIFQVIDRQMPLTPPLSEVREKVISDLRLEMGLRKSRELAELCLNKMNQTSFTDGMASFNAEIGNEIAKSGETEYLARSNSFNNQLTGYIVAMQGYRPNVLSKAFKLKKGDIALAVEDDGKKACYVITIIDKKEIERENFDGKKDQIQRKYLSEKQIYTLRKWENSLVKQSELNIGL